MKQRDQVGLLKLPTSLLNVKNIMLHFNESATHEYSSSQWWKKEISNI